jgi:hypothetical protein
MAVTPGLPQIGEQRFADYVVQQDVDIMLFHDGNQSGHVEKPIQEVNTTDDIVKVNDNIISDGATGSNTNQTQGPRGFESGNFGFLTDGQAFDISGSTGNDGAYTVKDMQFNFQTQNTLIYVNESITDSTGDGNAVFGNDNRSGRGDNLRDNDRLSDITTEPNDGGYTRAVNQSIEIFDDGKDWFVRTANDTVFDNLNDTSGRVDAVAVIDNWQALGGTDYSDDASAQDHILFTAFLDQLYLLDQTDKHTVDANTIRLAIR